MERDDVHPMQVPPEQDPEYQREALREAVEIVLWDAQERHLDAGDERPVTEPGLLTPYPLDEDGVEWTLRYEGEGNLTIVGPDGVERGEIDADAYDLENRRGDDPLDALNDPSVEYHRERAIEKAESADVGDKVFLPLLTLVEVTEDGYRFESGRDFEREASAISMDVIEDTFAEWQAFFEKERR